MDSVVVAEVAMVPIFPNVASIGIEERVPLVKGTETWSRRAPPARRGRPWRDPWACSPRDFGSQEGVPPKEVECFGLARATNP